MGVLNRGAYLSIFLVKEQNFLFKKQFYVQDIINTKLKINKHCSDELQPLRISCSIKKNDHTAWGWRLGWGSSISLELLVSKE